MPICYNSIYLVLFSFTIQSIHLNDERFISEIIPPKNLITVRFYLGIKLKLNRLIIDKSLMAPDTYNEEIESNYQTQISLTKHNFRYT